jgi:hypothetical protein
VSDYESSIMRRPRFNGEGGFFEKLKKLLE